jgi:uncharacterized protein (DUF58 family)
VNFAKLNHVLIPSTKAGRDRLRRSALGRLTRPVGWLYAALSSEGRVLAVLVLLLGAMAMEVYGTRIYLLWSALVGMMVAALLVRFVLRLDRVRVEVRAPPRVSVGEPLRFEVVLHNEGERDHPAVRVSGPFLPWDGRWIGELPVFGLLPARGSVRGEARASFIERGEHHLDPFMAAALAPFGLAVGPAVRSSGCRFLVVPRIAPVERVTLPLGDRYQPGGIAQASRIGEAMELMGVRPYRRGDPVRDLHALTWARTGSPHVREYQQEYFSRVGVILDNDRTVVSDQGLEAAVSLAAGVVACLSRGEALIDLLVVDGQVHPLTVGRSLGFLEQALDLLACVQPGAPLETPALLGRLEPYLAQLSCVLLITEASIEPEPALAGQGRRAAAGAEGPGAERRWPADLLGRGSALEREASESRRQLVEALEARGVRCRVLRISRRPRSHTPKLRSERIVPVEAVQAEEPLLL